MKRPAMPRLLQATACLGGVSRFSARAMAIHIRHAAEIETEHGHYCQLQHSTNMVDWLNESAACACAPGGFSAN
jgi:hypothetical protein